MSYSGTWHQGADVTQKSLKEEHIKLACVIVSQQIA